MLLPYAVLSARVLWFRIAHPFSRYRTGLEGSIFLALKNTFPSLMDLFVNQIRTE